MLNIADISVAQGCRKNGNQIVWTDVARWTGPDGERVDAVIVKATEGNDYVDPAFIENTVGAAATDLLLGWYHFAHPDDVHVNDPVDEATHFVDVVRSQGFVAGTHLLALDIEEARKIHAGPDFVRWVLAFCDAVESFAGAKCAIYTGGPFFDSESGTLDAQTSARIARHPLWLAAYVTRPDKYVPKPWRESGYVLHQDTGDFAPVGKHVLHVAGISRGIGNVDHDVYAGTREELEAFVAGTRSTPTTRPSPPPDPPDPRTVLQRGGSTLADEIHAISNAVDDAEADTSPQTPGSRSQSSQKMAAVDAPIVDPQKGS